MEEDINKNLMNDTCGDAAFFGLDCVDTFDQNALGGVYFMETANDFRMSKGSNYNFQIGGALTGNFMNIKLVDALNNPFECNNLIVNSGDIQLSEAPNCFESDQGINCPNGIISIFLGDDFTSQLLIFSCTQSMDQPAEPDMWKSSVST